MNYALTYGAQLLRNKFFWYAIIAVVFYVVIKRNYYKLQEWTAPSWTEPTTNGTGQVITISAQRLFRLRELAGLLKLNIYSYYGFTATDVLQEVSYLTDTELKYVARYYKEVLLKNKTTLYADLDDEILPGTDADDRILNRLTQMGLQ